MRVFLDKSEVRGEVPAPPSKSYTIRALICASLAKGESRLDNPLEADDTRAAREVLGGIGASITENSGFWLVEGDNFHEPARELFCYDSAATLRFMLAVCCFVPGQCRLVPSPLLARRPIAPLIKALKDLGAGIREEGGALVTSGRGLDGGLVEMAGDMSSQFISAILLVAPLARSSIQISLNTPPQSKDYIRMTISTMASFGVSVEASADLREFRVFPQEYHPAHFKIEGDWSSASFLLALGATSGRLKVTGLNLESLQADRLMLDLLRQMGARIDADGGVRVAKSELLAISADLKDAIDLLPPLGALAALAKGESVFNGIGRARLKESDRVKALKENLGAIGIQTHLDTDRLFIKGGKPHQGVVKSFDDHRIAMAFSIIGASKGGLFIEGAECVTKTYPDYWDIIKSLGVKLSEQPDR